MTIRQINWETGCKNSHEPKERTCVDCGIIFYTHATRHTSVKRCPTCAAEYRNEQDSIRKKVKNKTNHRSRWHEPGEGDYRIIIDPDETWGYNSRLGKHEITHLIKNRYIETGTVFQRLTDGLYFWVCDTSLRELAS